MRAQKRYPAINIISFLLFSAVFILHYSGGLHLSIRNAEPLSLLPLLCAFSMFAKAGKAAFAGFALGICMDGVSSGAYCFNAIVLMLSAALVSALCDNMLNKNIRTALLLSFMLALVYFSMRWLILYAFKAGVRESLVYLFEFAFPSVIYTAVFILPFYFIYKYFNKLKTE